MEWVKGQNKVLDEYTPRRQQPLEISEPPAHVLRRYGNPQSAQHGIAQGEIGERDKDQGKKTHRLCPQCPKSTPSARYARGLPLRGGQSRPGSGSLREAEAR